SACCARSSTACHWVGDGVRRAMIMVRTCWVSAVVIRAASSVDPCAAARTMSSFSGSAPNMVLSLPRHRLWVKVGANAAYLLVAERFAAQQERSPHPDEAVP